jgi:hypothetical protein
VYEEKSSRDAENATNTFGIKITSFYVFTILNTVPMASGTIKHPCELKSFSSSYIDTLWILEKWGRPKNSATWLAILCHR